MPDPGIADLNPRPVVPNPDFDPQYRSITTPFETWAGHTTITDLAVWTIGVAVNGPGAQLSHPAKCLLDATETPQLFAADRVYATRPNSGTWATADRTFTLSGTGFGAGATVSLVNEDPVVNGVGNAVTAPDADLRPADGEHDHVHARHGHRGRARTRSTSPTTRAGSARSTC